MQRYFVIHGLVVVAALAANAAAQVAPETHLGHSIGADFFLPDWKAVSSWYTDLDKGSARVTVDVAGKTTEGREFLACTITSEANMARLDLIRKDALSLADPRGLSPKAADELIARAIPIVMISNAMHSTEVAAPQFAMELAWSLATSSAEPWKSIRDHVVVVILPCTNPDGLDKVAHWYMDSVGKSFEGSGLPWLYQPYAGHDNNRDWFMLSLEETRIVSSLLYERWHPQIYWDVHQQGSFAERMFVPPFRDPLDPNLDASVMGTIDLIGTRAALDMTSHGLKGVASAVSFDMWWHGGNRNVPVRHNMIGLLTEAASANLASPLWVATDKLKAPAGLARYAASNRFRVPWPGGWWRVRDIVDYEMAFANSLLQSVSREPSLYTRTVLEAARRTCELGVASGNPAAWVIPADNRDTDAVLRLCGALLKTGVEIQRATAPLQVDGRALPAGSLVIASGQPAWRHVNDLFEIQAYPGDEPPYDVAGWTLPALMGVEALAVQKIEAPSLAPLVKASDARTATSVTRDDASDLDGWRTLFARLARGEVSSMNGEGFFKGAAASDSHDPHWTKLPRIAVYQPFTASMDEGWLRWTLEYCGLPYQSVNNARLRDGHLEQLCDVLVMPDLSSEGIDHGREAGSVPEEYAGGLEREGRLAIDAFVRGGGRLVAIGRAASWTIDLFQIPLKDAAHGKEAGDFSCPGSVLRAQVEALATDPFSPKNPRMGNLFFSDGLAWTSTEAKPKDGPATQTLASYAASDLLLSGWVRSPNVIAGKAAWVRSDIERGRVHLFAFSPYYRSWTQGTFHWLLRALMDERAQ